MYPTASREALHWIRLCFDLGINLYLLVLTKCWLQNVGRCLQHTSSLTDTDCSGFFLPWTRGPRGSSASSTQPLNALHLQSILSNICLPRLMKKSPTHGQLRASGVPKPTLLETRDHSAARRLSKGDKPSHAILPANVFLT